MLEVLDLGSASQIHCQWQQTFSESGSFSQKQVRSYWESLFLGLNLPRGTNANLSIAVPCCYDCLTRSTIMDILTRDYGYNNIKLIPRSLALVGGYLARHPQNERFADLLCIWPEKDYLDFSFISSSASCISLELQCIGSWAKLQEEAHRLGLLNTQGWNISQLLYTIPSPVTDLDLPFLELGQYMNVLKVEDFSQTILLGLSYLSTTDTNKSNQVLRLIYPYDYYLERSSPQKKRLVREKIFFDTSNLELDLNRSYKIANLAATSLYLDPEDSFADLAIYEVERGSLPLNPFNCGPATKLRLNQANQTARLDFWLDMDSASISQEINVPKAISSESMLDNILSRSHEHQRALAKLLHASSNLRLQKDLAHDLDTKLEQESPHDLEGHLKTIQLKLYGLLELWSGID